MTTRSGIGIDIHPLVEGPPLVLGGVTVPFEKGLSGHSDGDVLTHSIIDALLGGAGLGDIGTHFPSNDPQYAGIDSTQLLSCSLKLLEEHQWLTAFVDATILAERPILKQFMSQIKQTLSACLLLDPRAINLKATTTDGLGLIGRGEGIASLAIVTLEKMV